MEMEEQYGLSDLRQLITRSTPTGPQPPAQFPPYPPPPPDLFSAQHQHQHHHHHHNNTNNNNNNNTTTPTAQLDMVVMGRHVTADILHQGMSRDRFNSDTTPGGVAVVFGGSSGFDSGAARWPRQETLTLLEVRSGLDHKFKEANQKGPLWDEVARIMSEEHGYQRSGKKCREKFENLYKYYKKTKEGKAGRQDGKHYRFFRQLEALYGDHSSSSSHHHHHHHQRVISSVSDTYIDGNTPHYHPNNNSISPSANTATIIGGGEASLSLSSDFATSSSSDDEDGSSESERKKKRKGKRRSWKAKIKEFIDLQMRKIMEKQEAWLEKMMKAIEKRELERREREEEWKKQEIARIEREHKFWAGERAWIEARDTALMKALNKITSGHHLQGGHHWAEPEITKLIQLRTAMESRFEQCGFSEEVLWEDIAAKMAYFGYERSSTICKDKWDCINKELQDKGNLVKKRKDNNKNNNISNNDTNYGVISNHNGGGLYINHHHQHVISGLNHGNNCEINEPRLQLNDGSSSSPSSHNSNINVNVGNVMNDSCLRFFLGDGDHNLGWESNYGVKTQHGS